jgi:hypothetical protein
MSLLCQYRVLSLALAVAAGSGAARGQSGYAPEAGEYAIVGNLPGDQVFPATSLSQSGGYIVWQDNITDGDGWGVSACKLDSSFSPVLSNFRVNVQGAGDQENAQVSLLNGGGAAFIWQGGPGGFQHIFARFLADNGTWTTGDVLVDTATNYYQVNPAISTLTNGNVVAVWGSFNEVAAGSMQDVFAQRLSPAGQAVGGEIAVNQFTAYNQRTPCVAALAGGGFVVAWVSEQERFANSVDVYARIFDTNGSPVGNEFLVNTSTNVCANPSVAAAPDGSFAIAWGEQDATSPTTNSWDVYVRVFSGAGTGGTVGRVNTYLYGDQYAPKISYAGGKYLEVWTSLAQDGARKGIYGQFLNPDGSPAGGEFRVSTTIINQDPAVSSDGVGQFLAVWTSYVGGVDSFDLYAQRYASTAAPLPAAPTPSVIVTGSNSLSVTWPAMAGYSVADYEVYADGAAPPTPTATVTNDWWSMTGLAPSSTHSFTIDYVLTGGQRSPLSAPASGTTWSGLSWGGIPFEWMEQYYGADISKWPAATAALSPGGPTLLYVFLSGGNPLEPATWLKMQLQQTSQGLFLSWNPQPGLIYQVQTSTNNMTAWTNLGAPRFAAGNVDSIYVGAGGRGYYRVLRLQ